MNRSRGAARRLRERDIHRRVDIVAAAAARQRISSALSKTESVVHRARRNQPRPDAAARPDRRP